MRLKRKHILALGLTLVAVPLLYPLEHTVAPALRMRVFDETGNPAAGVVVKQEWEYRVVGSEMQSAYSRTDTDGYVSLPRRSKRVSLLRKVLSVPRILINPMHNDGIGPTATAWGHGADAHVWAYVGCGVDNPAPQELRLKRWPVAMHP
jgi:hypothetical protein